ncbi:MAG TPA: ABC transporter ATP-binding protein [Alphaproteobacteria bacterium]|nr:ABC transporter ATP-binding protein [Alphaproteobacteria bacterium]
MATEVLRLGGVDAFYGDSHVLHAVGFTVHAGRLLALLGRNGAGKTTCLNTVIGFLPPRQGNVALFGEAIAGLPPETIARKGVGLVPQGRRVFRSLSVDENLRVAARGPVAGSKGGWSLERVYEVFPRLRERRAQAAGLLSGGEQQMLAIGRALMSNPRLLLMDEPSEGLAPQIVHEVGRIIAALKADGLSIVLVEQNIKMSLNVADDVVLLNTGRVVYEGDVAGVRNDERLVAQHLGVF